MQTQNRLSPTQIIILGGTGDLAKRKLLPALFNLYVHKKLPEVFSIIGYARSERTADEYKEFVKKSVLSNRHDHDREVLNTFLAHIDYVSGLFDDKNGYIKIKKLIDNYSKKNITCSNKLFYLAVPPRYYETIFKFLSLTSLMKDCDETSGWSRILIEKPFGNDYKSAQALDKNLSFLFKEEQIFRIDHYLAKEAVQNILSFRFANPLLMPAWNSDFIEKIEITMKETIDVGERGNFYESVGALRDVGQNHLLQILALTTMQQPELFNTEHIRHERANVLTSLRFVDPLSEDAVVRAQYEGFIDSKGVDCDSQTETYFEIKAYIDNKKWHDVPIFITAGKALDEASVEVRLTFKDISKGLFESAGCKTHSNNILLRISPEQSMHITLNAKQPGFTYQVEPRTLSFECDLGDSEIKNSYEKVLLDCIYGDQTLFTSTEEVLGSWKYITSILEYWDKVPLQTYKKGSDGPKNHIQ